MTKIGRNDPCPCGSGKKYKKCCYVRDADGAQSTMSEINDLYDFYTKKNQWLTDELSQRTPGEVLYDDTVLNALRKGVSITEALLIAKTSHPEEALKYTDSNIDDIEEHYRYLLNYLEIMRKFYAINGPMNNTNTSYGIAWYDTPESFNDFKKYCSDPDFWEDSYDEWLENAIQRENELKVINIKPVRVIITLNDFIAYCYDNTLEPNSEARAGFVAYLLKQGTENRG